MEKDGVSMKFVIEVQEFNDDSAAVVTPIISRKDYLEGESEYCRIRSIASTSSVPVHSVFFIDSKEGVYDYRIYNHTGEEHP